MAFKLGPEKRGQVTFFGLSKMHIDDANGIFAKKVTCPPFFPSARSRRTRRETCLRRSKIS